MDFTMGAMEGGLMAAVGPAGAALKGVSATSKFGKLIKVGDDALDACRMNSFVPGTLVAMAGGIWSPIEDIEAGDYVLATDPETGEVGERMVLEVITGEGLKDLVNITVNDVTLTATAGHPFWVQSEQAWVDAGDLKPGDAFLSIAGEQLVVQFITDYHEPARVHNLIVEDIHTYYVQAGSEEVLVHNCGKVKFTAVDKQLQRKFKHASDFGIKGSWNSATKTQYRAALQSHVDDPVTLSIQGTYNRMPSVDVMHHLNPKTGLNVMTKMNGEFISGWRLNPDQFRSVLGWGRL